MYKRSKSGGFTLLELMIVVVIIAMLASFAIPAYQRYAQRARRADGKELLMRVAAAQERYYTNFNRYAGSPLTAATSLGLTSTASDRGYYTIDTANGASGNNQSYVLTVTPVAGGAQAGDRCGAMTINNTGVKTPAAGVMPQNSNGACW
jgi:type IV pilus assembly protein PilE